jgi:tRNA-guanine family transglycosylase
MLMPSLQPTADIQSNTQFEIQATAGDARRGTLSIGDSSLETPNLFPVLSFFGGGTKQSVFGGGIHRTVKEFMIGDEAVGGGDYTEYFDGAMMSVASLTDYGINKERFEDYTSAPIKQRTVFEPFDGTIFLDSGGFKFLNDGKLDGSDFELDIDQRAAFEIQRKLGGDIIVNLDQPIEPDDTYNKRVKKARQTAENAAEFLRLSADYEAARYLTVHGYNYSMVETFLDEMTNILGEEIVKNAFDGIALGSLVPKKDNKGELITAVKECREALDDYGFADLPFHVLGISSSSIPILVALGVDTFDSSSYLLSAINGKYYHSLVESVQLDDVDFSKCSCPVCSTPQLVDQMKGNTEYRKDELGPVAMHNLIIQKREIKTIREMIERDGAQGLIDYIESTVGQDKVMRQFAHQVVNEGLGGYNL